MPKKMHLAQFMLHGPTWHSLAAWRHPRNDIGFHWARPALYQEIARLAELGKFDMVFFGDLLAAFDNYQRSLEAVVHYAVQFPVHDPVPTLTSMAAVTSRVGLASTFSVTYHQPFYAARLWATIDHMSEGRAGWNVVTSGHNREAQNFGEERIMPHDLRYDRADEFLEVCYKLWSSWEEDAIVMDQERGIFADPAKVRRIDHAGQFFRCRGPLNVARSPQNGPAIIQAGASERGRTFAAKHADAVFAVQPFVEGASALYSDIKSRVENLGRNPDDCKIFFSVQPFVAETEQEAREKQELHNTLVPPEAGLAILSGHLGYDFSRLGLDDVVEHYEVPGSQGIVDMYTKVAGKKVTVREIAQMHGRAVGGLQMVGNPEQVADQLEAYFQQAGGDGFMIVAGDRPGTLRDFVELVVPVLQRRGLFRKDYTGTTLRDHLRED